MSKPESKSETKWFIWRPEIWNKNLDKFDKYAKNFMNRAKRRQGKRESEDYDKNVD